MAATRRRRHREWDDNEYGREEMDWRDRRDRDNRDDGPRKRGRRSPGFDDDHRQRSPYYGWVESEYSEVVMCRDADAAVRESDVRQTLSFIGKVRDVRATDYSRGRCTVFAAMDSANQATEVIRAGPIAIQGLRDPLRFVFASPPNSVAERTEGKHSGSDWVCSRCQFDNFGRRTECYNCKQSRYGDGPADDRLEGLADTGVMREAQPSPVLIIKGLDPASSDDGVRKALLPFGVTPLNVRLIRDRVTNVSRGFCFVDFPSIEHSSRVLKSALALQVDGKTVTLGYAKSKEESQFGGGTSTATDTAAVNNAHNRAMAVLGKRSLNQADPIPPGFMRDPQGSFWYVNEKTGYYFDPRSQLYYLPSDGQYYYKDQKSGKMKVHEQANAARANTDAAGAFLAGEQLNALDNSSHDQVAAEQTSQPELSQPVALPKPDDTPKPSEAPAAQPSGSGFSMTFKAGSKIAAKKSIKNVAKWNAKALELHESAQEEVPKDAVMPRRQKPSITRADTRHIIEARNNAAHSQPTEIAAQTARGQETDASSKSANSSEKEVVTAQSETAAVAHVCELCQRGFATAEKLKKHEEKSQLHKENLEKKRIADVKMNMMRVASKRDVRAIHIADNKRKKAQEEAKEDRMLHVVAVQNSGTDLNENNVGNKLMKAMGWTEGQGLGKSNQGSADAVKVELREERAGLGSANAVKATNPGAPSLYSSGNALKDAMMQRAKDRLDQCSYQDGSTEGSSNTNEIQQ